ncbi:ThuA domain-containing protein [Microlunatus ginsengisoli]|uniref:ThuA-like domain-containing protein n=1 Tax=Microlunatus ginsengisoli TaxID=363863 RepID=A0ABP7ATN5_9ACTN
MRVLVLSGAGRYADPWHDFAATSAALAGVLAAGGREVSIEDDVERGLADLAATDLLVVNVGNPTDGAPAPASAAAIAGLRTYVGRGGPVLAVHTAATTFTTEPDWSPAIGGRWVRGTTMHPPFGPALVRTVAPQHPVAAGVGDLELDDERYSYLATEPGVSVLYEHEHDGRSHPVIWALETAGGRRAVYDGLGHTAATYEHAGHRRLLRQAAGWLLRDS